MSDILEFLTSKEIIMVYAVIAMAMVVCLIVYIVEKNATKRRQRHNTRELNKLVEQIKEEVPEEENEVIYNEPVLEASGDLIESSDNEVVHVSPVVVEESSNDIQEVPQVQEEVNEIKEEVAEEELQYTTIEPDQETAKMELQRITEELLRQEEEANRVAEEEYAEPEIELCDTAELEKLDDTNEIENIEEQQVEEKSQNIELTSYEEQQENDAIISLDEFTRRGKEIYEANELTQYDDEGNEPISIQDLDKKMKLDMTLCDEPFIISNAVPEKAEEQQLEPVMVEEVVSEENKEVVNNIEENKKFKNSPIISPIYGIEKDVSENSLELENTANYEKLDNEIKKANDFLMTLKELQKNLD